MTQPLSPSPELAYFIGVFSGDGSLSRTLRTSRTFKLAISCSAVYPELISVYKTLIETLTLRTARVLTRNGGRYFEVYTYGNELPILLSLPVGRKTFTNYQIAEWVFSSPQYARCFLRGLIETDGGIYHEYRNDGWCSRCLFTADYEPILQAFLRASSTLGYVPSR